MNDGQVNSSGWFDNTRVAVIKFQDLLAALERGEIGLPAFQRGRAWGPARIAFLWDSLLRGYPMGSLMVIPSGSLGDEQKRAQQKAGLDKQNLQWLLLDGQQRCATISLASGRELGSAEAEEEKRDRDLGQRLWIDLDQFQNDLPAIGQQSPFYLTTFAHPWGVGVKDGTAEAATEKQKRERGREQLKKWVDDKDEPDDMWRLLPTNKDTNPRWPHRWVYPDPWLNLRYTWPVQAGMPIPVDELISRLSEDGERELSVAQLPQLFMDSELWCKLPGRDANDLDKPLHNLCEALKGILDYEVVLIQVPKEDASKEQDAPERLNDVFQRINRQGATLSDAELFFSTVKMHHPSVHEDVERIHQDQATGKVLDPLQIVHGAARLARSEPGPESSEHPAEPDKLNDVPRLTLSRYKSLVRDPEGGEFPKRLVAYLQHQEGTGSDTSILHATLQNLRKALSYQPEPETAVNPEGRDCGLPLPLLAQLSWRVWHTLAAWGVERDDSTIQANRKGLICYALVYHFFNNSIAEWGTRYPFLSARLKGRNADTFPDGEVLAELNTAGYLYGYQPGRDSENSYPSGILKPDHYDCYARQFSDRILHNERDLLFWSQRDAVHRWFDDLYDPLHHAHTDDRPFDFDHIVPSDWFMNVREGSKCREFDRIWWFKDCIGNLRVWPRPLNQSEGNRQLSRRWLITEPNEQNEPNKEHYTFWGLDSSERILADSAIDPGDDVPKLQRVDVLEHSEPKDWTSPERCEAFEEFAKQRRCRLYQEFFKTLNLDKLERALCKAEFRVQG